MQPQTLILIFSPEFTCSVEDEPIDPRYLLFCRYLALNQITRLDAYTFAGLAFVGTSTELFVVATHSCKSLEDVVTILLHVIDSVVIR